MISVQVDETRARALNCPFSLAASVPYALSVSIDAHVHRLVSDRSPDDMMFDDGQVNSILPCVLLLTFYTPIPVG